ncbi:uncharacterized protein cenpt [Fundulus diaphanus]
MDPADDLSARVLLRHIQNMEPPRTPINSSEDQAPSDSPLPSGSPLQHGRLLRSSKTRRESEFQSPQNIVRRSLRHKIHQSITRKSLLAAKRRTPSIVLRKLSVSTLSPRQLLKLIQETGPVMSPLVHESAPPAELQPPSADPNLPSLQSSIELSGLDLSDPSMGDASIQKGLSRKRPRRSLNVTAFEKLLKDAAKKRKSSAGENSSLSPSSSTSLSLQSPFDTDAEKRGIQRKVPHHRRTSGRSFNAAMSKQQIGGDYIFSLRAIAAVWDFINKVCSCVRQLLKLIQETGMWVSMTRLFSLRLILFIVYTHVILSCSSGPVMSPLVHETAPPAELQPPSADHNLPSLQSSIELSGLDLSDPSMGDASIQKGLSRKRPRRSLNVTAFQKLLKDAAKKRKSSAGENSSHSPSSSTSLSLQSPFDTDAEKRGIQRKVPHHRRTSGRSFNAAMSKQQIGDVSSRRLSAQNMSEDANFEGITLGLSKLSETDAAVDIMNCHTTLYDPQGAVDSSLSILAAQDKATASTCQLQRELEEMQEERGEMGREKSVDVFSGEDGAATDLEKDECVPGSHGEDDVSKTESEDAAADGQPNDDHDSTVSSQSSKKEDADGFLTFEMGVRDESEEEEAAVEPQAEDEGMDPSQTEEEAVADSQSEEEGVAAGAQTEDEDESESQAEDVVVQKSQCDVEEPQAAEDASGLQTNDEAPQEEEWESEQLERDTRHVGHRTYRSEGRLVLPVPEALTDAAAGSSDIGSKGLGALDFNTSLEVSPSQIGTPDEPEPSLQERLENEPVGRKSSSSHLLQVSHDAEACEQRRDGGDAPAEDAAEQQEEWDDDEEEDTDYEELPDKTPAFVKQKRIFLASNPPPLTLDVENVQASSSSEALPKAKQKQVRRKKTEAVLPKTCLMSVFKHFAKTKVSADVFPALNNVMDKFLDRLSRDLETYAAHAKRKTITVDDVKLLLRRQGYINDKMPVEVLIEKYLRMEQRRILIPIATSGNVVIPKIKK